MVVNIVHCGGTAVNENLIVVSVVLHQMPKCSNLFRGSGHNASPLNQKHFGVFTEFDFSVFICVNVFSDLISKVKIIAEFFFIQRYGNRMVIVRGKHIVVDCIF